MALISRRDFHQSHPHDDQTREQAHIWAQSHTDRQQIPIGLTRGNLSRSLSLSLTLSAWFEGCIQTTISFPANLNWSGRTTFVWIIAINLFAIETHHTWIFSTLFLGSASTREEKIPPLGGFLINISMGRPDLFILGIQFFISKLKILH